MHLKLDRSDRRRLADQVFSAIKEMILDGALRERLPPTRRAARDAGVSRTVIVEAYDRLAAEGFITGRHGSGTFVAPGVAFRRPAAFAPPSIEPVGFRPLRFDLIDFRSGVPDLSRFPIGVWKRLTGSVLDGMKPADLAYAAPEGRAELRAAIADYLRRARGVRCHPEQILVTSGTTQAVGIVSTILLGGRRRNAVVEDPVTRDIRHIIAHRGGRPVSVPLDEAGLMVSRIPRRPAPSFIYVTPSHQFPLGMTMPAERRIELLERAAAWGAYVVEDDYDSEFRHELPPTSSLQELDPGRVVYIGSFSKTLFPALRTGFLVLPPALLGRARRSKWEIDLHNPTVDQLVLAAFISGGHFARHIERMRRIYRRKRDLLLAGLAAGFGGRAAPFGSEVGMHVAVRFAGARFDQAALSRLMEAGVIVYPVDMHARRPGAYSDCAILGFGHLEEQRIERGLHILERVLAAGR